MAVPAYAASCRRRRALAVEVESAADPALATLSHVDDVTRRRQRVRSVDHRGQGHGAGPGLQRSSQLTPRMGDPNDRIFAFDAAGARRTRTCEPGADAGELERSHTPMRPSSKLDVIEVYANDNCMAYSVKDKKPIECTRSQCRKSPASCPDRPCRPCKAVRNRIKRPRNRSGRRLKGEPLRLKRQASAGLPCLRSQGLSSWAFPSRAHERLRAGA